METSGDDDLDWVSPCAGAGAGPKAVLGKQSKGFHVPRGREKRTTLEARVGKRAPKETLKAQPSRDFGGKKS